jgi:diadenosine tetraphosphatase ApaH/serine/threonine PP2A family protein phosphatase
VDELASLPQTHTVGDVLYCHASPGSDVDSFLPEAGDDEDELLEGITSTRVVFGHTHLAFSRTSESGIELVNPGSVGMPLDGDPRAAYAVVGDDGEVTHRRVGYDHAASAEAVREQLGKAGEVSAARIERASADAG